MSISGGKGKKNNSSDGNSSLSPSRSGQQRNSSFVSPFIELSNIAFIDGEKELGRGGFGIVKRGIYDGKQVAVKSLMLDDESLTISGLDAAELLLSEANKMRELQHPRIVSFLGFIMENCSLVLEFMPNGGLDQFLNKNREMNIPWAVRLLLALDVAEGMAYLHSKQYLNGRKKPELFHQDLKSGNVLLCVEDDALRAKISDFGLSVITNRTMNDEGSKLAGGGTRSYVKHVGGTQLYMAPELFRSAKFTKSCDVYAYGVVLLEIAVVAKPTECLENYPDNIKDNAGVPNPVKTVVDLALSLDPANRPSFDVIYSMLKSNESFIESSSNNLIRKSSSAAKTPSGNELEVVGMSDTQNTLQAATPNVPFPNYPSISCFIEPFDIMSNTRTDIIQSCVDSEYENSVLASYLTPSEINGSPKKQTHLRESLSSRKSSNIRLFFGRFFGKQD